MIKKTLSHFDRVQKRAIVPAVEIQGLQKLFSLRWQKKSLIALEELDLEVQRGEIFGLLGPNGSGKSTTMKLMLGLLYPTKGQIKIFGHTAGTMQAKKSIGFLPENPYFPQFLTGEEMLRYFGELCGLHGKKLHERIRNLFELVDLKHAAQRRIRTYSKGMLQRIGLAQALLHEPELLLLDEPTAGVDPIGSRRIRDLMIKLKEQGKTIIFSSHLLEQVEDIVDRVVILERGRKLRYGRLNDMLTNHQDYVMRLHGLSEAKIQEVKDLLQQKLDCSVTCEPSHESLESFFINLLGRDKSDLDKPLKHKGKSKSK
ncbi:MAG: ABC transporter ATP-binding protein [Verrucomicrobiota bacterium]